LPNLVWPVPKRDWTFPNVTESSPASEKSKKNPPPRAGDKLFPNATESSSNTQFAKTNPNSPPAPAQELSPRQLLAARALCSGKTVGAVATMLGVARQTISRWKRDPRFHAELLRIHDFLARPARR